MPSYVSRLRLVKEALDEYAEGEHGETELALERAEAYEEASGHLQEAIDALEALES